MSEVSNEVQRKHILVADDDPAILRLVKAIVEKEGYVVATARDGKEAYRLLKSENEFEAAIFDISF